VKTAALKKKTCPLDQQAEKVSIHKVGWSSPWPLLAREPGIECPAGYIGFSERVAQEDLEEALGYVECAVADANVVICCSHHRTSMRQNDLLIHEKMVSMGFEDCNYYRAFNEQHFCNSQEHAHTFHGFLILGGLSPWIIAIITIHNSNNNNNQHVSQHFHTTTLLQFFEDVFEFCMVPREKSNKLVKILGR